MQTFKYMLGMLGKGLYTVAAILLCAGIITYGRDAFLFMASQLAEAGIGRVLLDLFIVAFVAGMFILEKQILAWVAESTAYRDEDRKDHQRYMVQTVTLHNFGIAGTCAYVMIHQTPQLYLNALALVCIALLARMTVQNLHCLYGKTGVLTNRKPKPKAPAVSA